MTISAICLEHLFSHMLVYTPWRRRRNALGAPCALCARRRCAVTTLCTPRARRERSVTTQSTPVRTPWERGGTPWVLLGNATVAVGAPWHLHVMENVKLFAIFFSIFVRSHGALRNFKSPCQRRGIAVECDRGLTTHLCVTTINHATSAWIWVYIKPSVLKRCHSSQEMGSVHCWNKMAAVSMTTFLNAFLWMEALHSQTKFHWNIFHWV